MGYSSWSDEAFKAISGSRSSARPTEIFRGEASIDPRMDPRGVRAREARDSVDHPNSVPIVVAFDVTGSMGDIPTRFAQSLLGKLMRQLLERGWVTDPQLLFAAIGDAESDRAPLQIGQFESGLEMDMWLTRIWLESGGGDAPESYTLAHWFAAHHTATDAWEKRQKKGYLFTIGDADNKPLQRAHVDRVFGTPTEARTDDESVIAAASARYETFHVLVTRGNPPDASTLASWRRLLGDRVLVLDETEAITELIGGTIALCERNLSESEALALLKGARMGERFASDVVAQLRKLGKG